MPSAEVVLAVLLAVPPVWELEQVRDVPQAAQFVARGARPVRVGALVAHSVVWRAGPLNVRLVPADSAAVHLNVSPVDPQDARSALSGARVVHSDALLADPRDARQAQVYSPAAHSDAQLAVRSDVSPADPQGDREDDYLVARLVDDHW